MSEKLFSFGGDLSLTQEQLDDIREVDVVPTDAEFLGTAVDALSGEYERIYRVNDEPVKLKHMDGIEG